MIRDWVAARIEARLGGYRHVVVAPDPALPQRLEEPVPVVVVGSGLAGLGAASVLAERGFAVTILEAEEYIGGKIGAWTSVADDGTEHAVSHGFHAFFHHYYNLNAWLDRLGLFAPMREIGDYEIRTRDGEAMSFSGTDTVPVLNLISLWWSGLYNMRDILFSAARDHMDVFLRYDPEETFDQLDEMSFAEFSKHAHLPSSLQLMFNTFSRAFFADAERMSMAELVKSFHFYYLSQDAGLGYVFPTQDYGRSLLEPISAHLKAHGAELRTGTSVRRIERGEGQRFRVAGVECEHVVVASSVPGTREILLGSEWLQEEAPRLVERVQALKAGQRYAVFRFWLDTPLSDEMCEFVITDRLQILDAIAVYHLIEDEAVEWVEQNGGAVMELHCYALPDDFPTEGVRDQLLAELHHFCPELAAARVVHDTGYVNEDFTALHVGMHAERPPVDTGVPGLWLAGDWVRLEFPAMLMEGAISSGLMAANKVLEAHRLSPERVESVPPKGILAGLKWNVDYKALDSSPPEKPV